jgi:uncharacterized membrane protein YqiK
MFNLAFAAQAALFVVLVFLAFGIRYVPNSRVGVVEKRFALRGSVRHGLVALKNEAGFQPDVLRGGLHYLLPIQYRVHIVPLVTIPQGRIGYVFARDGLPLAPDQALASNDTADDFHDVRAFLANGGQRGPQRRILREGTHALNLAQFLVVTESKVFGTKLDHADDADFARMVMTLRERDGFRPVSVFGNEDAVGIVTVHDGPSLAQGQIIAPIVGDDPHDELRYHNQYQDADRFLAAGGFRGRQLQVLVEGTYYLNRLFATIEYVPKTVVEVGTVGVVVSYTGESGDDLSGTDYKHGELVARGRRGVWSEPLLPGKYAFNIYAGRVIPVPTTNIILKWKKSEVGSHRLDENLAEVSLITKDAFEPSLPLSVVVHIDYREAPLVIQRFGDVKRLVEQTLDPMVAAYFKNVGQTRTLIELIHDRSEIQAAAGVEMKGRFDHYNLELEEVLIGTPSSSGDDPHIEQILTQLRSRQIASEQVETFARQKRAAEEERSLREAEARANQQQRMTEAEIGVEVNANLGRADYQRSLQKAAEIRAMADAEADRVRALATAEAAKVRALGEAEADKNARVGVAQAIAVEEQVRAYGGPRYQLVQQVMGRFSEAVEKGKIDVVPRIVLGAAGTNGATGGGSNALEALLTLLLSERVGEPTVTIGERSPEAIAVRERLHAALTERRDHEAS